MGQKFFNLILSMGGTRTAAEGGYNSPLSLSFGQRCSRAFSKPLWIPGRVQQKKKMQKKEKIIWYIAAARSA